MKTFYFNIQSKGGAGKSMLTYLQALKNEKNDAAAFADLDSYNKSSTKQLLFLQPLKQVEENIESRLYTFDVYDRLKRIERERLMNVIQGFSKMKYGEIFMDFGSSESEQFPALFSLDFSIEEFKEFEEYVQSRFVFNIVIAGGTLYAPCFDYAQSLIKIIEGKFEIRLYLNEMTFSHHNSGKLLNEITAFVQKQKQQNIVVLRFGNFQVERSSGQSIAENIRMGKGLGGLTSFAAKTIMKRELVKL